MYKSASLSFLFNYLKPFWPGIILILVLLLGQSLAELYLPTLMSGIVNDGIVYAAQTGKPRHEFIIRMGLQMLFFALLAGVFSIYVSYVSPKISAGAAKNLRRDLFIKIQNFSQAEFDKFSSASLITRCTNDVMQVQNLANIFARMMLYSPILAIGGIFMALQRAPSISWILGLAILVLFGIVAVLVAVVMPKFEIQQQKTDNLNRVSREILHGLMVIRAFGTREHEKKRFDNANKDLFDLGLFIARIMAVTNPGMIFIISFTQVLIVWVGARQIADSGLLIGDMMAFFQYSMQVLFAFMMISLVLVMLPRARVSARRIAEVLNTEISVKDAENPEEFPVSTGACGKVIFDGVSFSYPNAEACAVENVSFTALPGQTTAIIGATGSGKSTIAQLLLRFYDVSSGKITVDGTDIKKARQVDLRAKIGYVPQKVQLLSGTIESNIMYGVNASRAEAGEFEALCDIDTHLAREQTCPGVEDCHCKEKAASIAQALDFINEKEDGFLAEISQGGGNVSGGQRQRLSIARALAKNPEILIFDDSFSALDFQTDVKLRKALKENTSHATVIIIAQRIGTIIDAEQILVLDQGKITGRGTHAELLKTCPEYLEIAQSQGLVI